MTPYQYLLRPGYGSKNLLLEFTTGTEQETFLSDLFLVFKSIDFKPVAVNDLWTNDEVLLTISSTAGEFRLSKDIWNFVFIMADTNQKGLSVLDALLSKSGVFEKVEVDFSKYTL